MRAGDKFVTVTLRDSNGTTSSDQYRKTENVQDVIDVVKNYESKRQNACEEDFGSVKDCERVYSDECKCLQDAYEEMIQVLEPYKRYEVEGLLERDNAGNYFLGGYNTPIPETMAELIKEYYEDDLDISPLVEFWKKALLNPDERARQDLFDFISEYGITITDNGYMMLYKAVTTKEKADPDDDLAEFVGGQYLKRKNWGKNPADYYVYDLDEEVTLPNNHTTGPGFYVSTMDQGQFLKDVEGPKGDSGYLMGIAAPLGTLEELFDNREKLSRESETVYTDKHSHTFEYNLGETHSMPREECDSDPAIGCSRGLHVGSYDYVSSFGHSPSRDVIQAVLVNPMHVVAIPNHDNSKIRTCEFFSYGIMERDNDGVWHELETQYFEEDYENEEMDALEERLDELKGDVNNPTDKDVHSDQVKAVSDRLVDLRNN
jgi:hypothetical protein